LALAQRIWGRSGNALLPLINDQTLSITELRKQAHELGYIMDSEAIAAGQRFDDALKDASLAARGLKNQIGVALVPTITTLMERYRDWAIRNREVIKTRLEDWLTRVQTRVERFGKKADEIAQKMGGWDKAIEKVIRALGAFAGSIMLGKLLSFAGTLIAAGKELKTLAVLASGIAGTALLPLILVVAQAAVTFGAWFIVLQDVYYWLRGYKSAIGSFIDGNKDANTILGSMARLLEQVSTGVKNAARAIGDMLTPVVDALSTAFENLWSTVGRAMDRIGEVLSPRIISAIESLTRGMTSINEQGLARTVSAGVTGAKESAVRAGAPAAQSFMTGAGSTFASSFTGSPISISGIGLSANEAANLANNIFASQLRQAKAAFATGDR